MRTVCCRSGFGVSSIMVGYVSPDMNAAGLWRRPVDPLFYETYREVSRLGGPIIISFQTLQTVLSGSSCCSMK